MKALAEDFFRHEYGKLVASLCRRLGARHLELAEDAAQSALMKAVSGWPVNGEPDNPSAWLFRVAHNEAMGELRQASNRGRILRTQVEVNAAPSLDAPGPRFDAEIGDDLLRMLFVCCDPSIPLESQLALALKTLCGFSVGEISARLFAKEATIYKRLARARARLREAEGTRTNIVEASPTQLAERRPAVQAVIYLLFTEGHLSSHAEEPLRAQLCNEAIRLGTLLAAHPSGEHPSSFALLALMHLHRARMSSREDAAGGLVLLAEQERASWDAQDIATGMQWLAKSAEGETFSRYHAEASIAAEHCMAPSFEATRWERVTQAYALLQRVSPSPVHRLNQAVALAQWKGPAKALGFLEGFEPPTWLSGSYMWSAVLADLHGRVGDEARALRYREAALACAPTPAIATALARRLGGTA